MMTRNTDRGRGVPIISGVVKTGQKYRVRKHQCEGQLSWEDIIDSEYALVNSWVGVTGVRKSCNGSRSRLMISRHPCTISMFSETKGM